MITMDLVAGVHGVTAAGTNLYVVEDGAKVTLVDAGLPSMWDDTTQVLTRIGRTWDDVTDVVLTHGHFDHLGLLARATSRHRLQVWVHPADAHIVRHPYRYRPGRPRLLYPVMHPRSVPHLTSMVKAGALNVRGVEPTSSLTGDDVLDLPAGLAVVPTPGHTDGHCALHLPSRDVVFTGDALVTLDPYTGRTGPRIVARAGTHDARTAQTSLAAIGETGATTVLPGHGKPWLEGALEAGLVARRAQVA
jgi:glyoxylase-like metal-dependent hydrolase (beta-lactamase superfamily II)